MRTIRIAFYKNSKSFFGTMIRFKQYRMQGLAWVHAQYSHVELVFEDGCFYSSSEVDGGVRMKKIVDDKGNWDYIDLEVSDRGYQKIRAWCESKLGDRYNTKGIFFVQIFKTLWFVGREDFFCSEFCVKALQEDKKLCGVDGITINPAQLHKMLTQ